MPNVVIVIKVEKLVKRENLLTMQEITKDGAINKASTHQSFSADLNKLRKTEICT